MNLGARLVLALVPLIALPVAIAGWLVHQQLQEETRSATARHQALTLAQAEHLVEHELGMARANAAVLADNELVSRYLLTNELDRYTLLQPPLLRLLQDYQRVFPQYYEIRVLLPDGYEDVRSTVAPLPNDTEDESASPEFRAMAAAKEPGWSTLFVNPDNGRLAVLAGRRIRIADPAVDPLNTRPRTRGYLVITSDLPFLPGAAHAHHSSALDRVFVVDAGGQVVAHADEALLGTRPGSTDGGREPSAPQPVRDADGRPLTQPLGHGFSAMVSAPRPAAAGSGLKGGWLVAVATVLAILLCAAALFIMIRRLVLQPISALDRATREIGRGNLLAPVPDAGAPELRALADAFRTMGVSLHRSSEEARHLAYHDALTGLPNRTLLREKLEGAVAAARRGGQLLGVIFLDLDNFKQVNDTLGHARGDDLLAAVAELLCRSLRGSDLIARPATGSHPEEVVARLGGDEFTILLPAIHHERDAGQVAERIIDSLSRPVTLAGHQIHVGASIGITLFPADGDDAETLLKNADIAMYHAKDRGKNNFQFFSQAMNDRVSRRLGLEHRIRDALANDAFSLVYQPIVEVVSGRMVGVEALLRWIDPEGGGVSTGEMVAVAEECGLILDLGEWVLQEACRQAAAWPVESREEPFIAVNISGVQLTRGDIRHLVARTLAATGFDPRRLQLELTESSFLEVSEETHRGLSRLNELGVQICLDDFGTGYSSLGHLRTLPISRLKIDHSFVRDIDHGDGDHPLLSSIIALAHSLDLAVTAEGVETPEQLRFLERHGCDCVQGWLLGRPMPAAMVAGRLHERRRASGGSP